MSRIIKRPSPALVIAVVALVGVAVVPALGQIAVTAMSKKEKRVFKRIARFQANKQITRRASGLVVGNADKLDGLHATAFLRAGVVRTPRRVVMNDPVPGDDDEAVRNLLTAGPFTIELGCTSGIGAPGSEFARVSVLGPAGSSFAVEGRIDIDNSPTATEDIVTSTLNPGQRVSVGHLVAAAPGGQVLSVSASAEVNDPAGNCVFAVATVGP